MNAMSFTFESIAAPPSRDAVLREGIGVACKRLEPQGAVAGPDGEACLVRDDGSALITVRQRAEGFGEERHLVRIAIRVKEKTTDDQAIDTNATDANATDPPGPHAA
jgi:hypothetical protein